MRRNMNAHSALSQYPHRELVTRHIDFVYPTALRVVHVDGPGVGLKYTTLLSRRLRRNCLLKAPLDIHCDAMYLSTHES